MSSRSVATLLLTLGVSACQPLPQPFQDWDKGANPLLQLQGAAGVFVLPVSGAPGVVTTRLAEAMAEALDRAEVPAGTKSVNAESHQLHGRVVTLVEDANQVTIEIEWRMVAPNGRDAGSDTRQETVAREPWYRGNPALMRRLAQSPARAIAALVQGDAPPPVPAAVAARGRRVTVAPVDGAPGDGRTALQRALAEILRLSGIIVVPDFDAESLIVLGSVAAGRPERGRQRIEVSWALLYPDGTEAGRVDQDSLVVAGSLDGAWGETAFDVAFGAAEGLKELLRGLPRQN